MKRFERIDNTAPIVDVAENQKPNVQYSNFDLGRKTIGQALPYALIPIDTIMTLPNSEFWLNYDVQIQFRNPTVRKMLNGWRVYLHAYYNRNSDLWEGWNNFITKGRSGTMNLKIPHICTRFNKAGTQNWKATPFTPMSLYDYLGFAPEAYTTLNKYSGVNTTLLNGIEGKETKLANYAKLQISALKPMMYQRLWRDKYAPKNLLQNNKNLFPDNEDHFILSYNANEVYRIKYEQENQPYTPTGTPIPDSYDDKKMYTMDDDEVNMRIDCLRFRQFQGDRFTTASPFADMLRGEQPEMNLTINGSDLNVTIPQNDSNIYYQFKNGGGDYVQANIQAVNHAPASSGNTNVYTDDNNDVYNGILGSVHGQPFLTGGNIVARNIEQTLAINGTSITSAITLSQLRSLEVFTIFAERMARTNGDYNEMIKAQFGHNPRANQREAIYIGGSYQDIIQNSIFQTSESTEESKLGQQVAQGISANYNKLGHFKADDYGIIMVIMSIVPDTIYTTGINKLDTALTMEEQYYPIMNNLSAEPILNQELYVSGNEEKDKDVWGYAERFSEYKSRRNRVCGFSQLANTQDEYDSALVMARRFDSTPNYNANFVQGYPDAYSLDSFAVDDEPPFDFAVIADVNANYPMPYATIPQGLGTRA